MRVFFTKHKFLFNPSSLFCVFHFAVTKTRFCKRCDYDEYHKFIYVYCLLFIVISVTDDLFWLMFYFILETTCHMQAIAQCLTV